MAYYPAIGTTDVSGIVDSLNTTEQTPRNIADVLAEELKGIADNILPPNASQIAYDNTESGLVATNVQDAIDEVISSQADVIADTMADLTENKTAVVTDGVADFETIDGSLVKSLVVEIEPVQDLHGYTKPWAGGAGKNLLDRSTFVDGYVNTSGGISSADPTMQEKTSDFIRLIEGESYTFQVSVNNTEEKWIGIGLYDANKNFIRRLRDTVSSTEIRYTFTVPEGGAWARVSYRTYGIDENAQLELGSTATSYEPYSNICPISGYTQEDVEVAGKNRCTRDTSENIYNAGHLIPVKNGDTVYCYFEYSSTQSGKMYGAFATNKEETIKTNTTSLGNFDSGTVKSYTMTADGYFCVCYGAAVATYTVDKAMISTSPITAYEPYIGKTYTTPFNQTVYGGTLDVLTGELTIDSGYIASYNGETLPSTWISDRDVYAVGTTPTTGAQVVYELATPTTLSLTPQTVKSLVGENHISASTGDVLECKFSMMINGDDLAILLS